MNTAPLLPLVAFLPLLWLFLSLGWLKLATPLACGLGLGLSLILAVLCWGMSPPLALLAVLDGVAFAQVPILWVIFAALLTYAIAVHTGAMESIKDVLRSVSPDRRIQALLIAWGFGGFMESVAGFGTAVVVPAALLISIGFRPFDAAVICLLANTVAVAFGVVGIPVTTLAWITDLPVRDLALDIVTQLTPFVLVVPCCIVLYVTKSARGLLGVWPHTLAAGAGFGVVQYLAARYIGAELPAILGSLGAFGAILLTARLVPPRETWLFDGEDGVPSSPVGLNAAAQVRAWSPYLILLVLVLASRLVPPLADWLGRYVVSIPIYTGPGGKAFSVAWLLTPGTLLLIAAVLGGLIQGASVPTMVGLAGKTVVQMGKSAATIASIVAMAKVLSYSGMTDAMALALAGTTGAAYPFFAPVLGMLGTFITGSDTSANILFGQLQKQVALGMGASPVWIAAANTSGACVGKLISLQSIAIAGIATNLGSRESELLLTAFKYALVFILVMGALVLALA